MRPGDPLQLVVWEWGGTLLAAPLDQVVEVTGLDPDGSARSREGRVELMHLPGIGHDQPPRRAIIVRSGDGVAALPADDVEGITPAHHDDVASPPAWLARLDSMHVAGVVRLQDDRLAALLALDALLPGQ